MTRRWILGTLWIGLLVLPAPTLAAQDSREERIRDLEARLSRLEQKLDLLLNRLLEQPETLQPVLTEVVQISQELGDGTAHPEPLAVSVRTLESDALGAAAASSSQVQTDVDPPEPRVPINGYMEMHLNHDGSSPTTLDFHRFVLLFSHNFGKRIQFVSEVELEHGFVEGAEESGEFELEQAYLNFRINPRLNFRAGMMLTPMGIINETHEPPSFNGVERPFVDEFIIPSTWFANGAGLVGDLGHGFHYKAFVMSPLNGSFFDAAEGFRGGRQKGFFENARNLATVGRLEYRGYPGLNLGTSFWIGETGFDFRDLSAQLKIFEFDTRYSWKRFDGRGQFAITHLDDAAMINRIQQQQTGVSPNVAEKMRGFYLEGAVHLLPASTSHDLVGFYRYESFDTQYQMPDGFLPLREFDREAHVVGLTYYPYPDVAIKFDHIVLRNASTLISVPNQWNFGIGWWF